MAATLHATDGFGFKGWMVTELHLQGAELLTFALVHQFAQSGAGIYKGNTAYLSAWTGWSENTCRKHLTALVEKGLIAEVRGRENNSPFCFYKLAPDFYEKHPAKFEGSPRKNCAATPQNLEGTTPQNLRGEYNSRTKISNEHTNTTTSATRFVVPTLDEVTAYCQERGNGIDPQSFIDHYTSNGWMVGKTKMKDWRACIRTWEARRRENPTPQAPRPERRYISPEERTLNALARLQARDGMLHTFTPEDQ